jgi:hypothetical protein
MKQPISGLKGIKPRLSKPAGNGKLSRQEAQALDREYRIHRNQSLALRNHREQMLLGKSRGELIEKKLAIMQAGYLLSSFRQHVMAEPSRLAQRLVHGGFVEEGRRVEVQEMIRNDLWGMLEELANLPEQIGDPDRVQKIDPDLRSQVEDDDSEDAGGGGFFAHPSGLRRQAERAEKRRAKKTETMRRLRREGRIKS